MRTRYNIIIICVLVLTVIAGVKPKAQQTVKISVDANKTTGMLAPFWASQIIHPTEFLLTGWGKKYMNLITKSGAARQYVRIYNQPEKAFRKDAEGKVYYDWSTFDEMADMILISGNKLKVVFFGMPPALASHPESVRKRPYGETVCTSPPEDYDAWEKLCGDFTNHVIGKYGREEVKQWTFRCWNEPDGGFWYKSDLKEYLKLYDHFAKAVKSVCPEIKIGGPALTGTGTYKKPENLKMFLEHVVNGVNYATAQKGSPIDFIAIHTYGGTGAGGGPDRKFPEVDYLMEQHIRYADMRDEYPELRDIPIHVEEWGESSGGTSGLAAQPLADIRNSQYGAAFLATWVGRHVRMRLEKDRKIESFTFCASGYEIIPEYDFMGYRTLDTKSGFHKPLLNGYRLLNKMDGNLIQVQKGTDRNIEAFATSDSNRICIVIVNYQHEHPFNDGVSKKISLQVKPSRKSAGNMTLKHWRIDDKHSNAYTVFKELGSPKLPNPVEIDAVKKRMDLELLDIPKEIKNRDLANIQFFLPCNAVSLIEIIHH
jgi:xylan 1,4-beta-xylosidase